MIRVGAKDAEKILKKLGLDYGDDGVTYYAYNEKSNEVYSFDTKKERDAFVIKAQARENAGE